MYLLIKLEKGLELYCKAKQLVITYETQQKVHTSYTKSPLQQLSASIYAICLAISLKNFPLQQIRTGRQCQNIFMYLLAIPCSSI